MITCERQPEPSADREIIDLLFRCSEHPKMRPMRIYSMWSHLHTKAHENDGPYWRTLLLVRAVYWWRKDDVEHGR